MRIYLRYRNQIGQIVLKENTLDILMHLFENYMDDEQLAIQDQSSIKTDLHEAGFSTTGIQKALDWLADLANDQAKLTQAPNSENPSIRVYSAYENQRLDGQCQGFLIFLENLGVLNAATRELVITRSFALEEDEVSLEQLKWVTLMVLFNQPGQEANFTWMEDLVYETDNSTIH